MSHPPAVVAFDVIETLFSLESMRPRLKAAGIAEHALETWFAQILRDGLALDAAGVYRPFQDVAAATLRNLLALSTGADPAQAEDVMAGFSELDAQPDAAPAMHALREKNVRIVALTNGGANATHELLERSGLREFVEQIVSIDEVRRWKPRREVYLHCAEAVGEAPRRLALMAAHAWDVHGAGRAGLTTGFVNREGALFPSTMDEPDVEGSGLAEVVEALVNGP